MSEKTGFAKQTLNKIAEVALSTQIKAQKLEVDIETNLQKITHLFTTFSEILDLKNLEKAGTTLTLDQFEITSGWLHLKANAHIDEFPSS
ncbi:hypothetical protein IQ236_17515 [Planktothrix mougeotii LEGE 06226]|uniref:Uncharacterized protein n=2 Tax=Planktothrix mougeotii TaxID=54306 RepID=A0ABR9UEW3_9CYAN|nr:hypothetical protein [Planktothrix mougeotii LEGE 06226]